MTARRLVVLGREHAAERGADTEYGKIRSGDQFSIHALSLAFGADAQVRLPSAEHSVEDRVAIAKIFVHRLRKFVASVVAAVVRTAPTQQPQLRGALDRRQAQQDLIDKREDRR